MSHLLYIAVYIESPRIVEWFGLEGSSYWKVSPSRKKNKKTQHPKPNPKQKTPNPYSFHQHLIFQRDTVSFKMPQ